MSIASIQKHPEESGEEIYYPESDGMPMAESDEHGECLIYCRSALRAHFADRPEVYVSGNNFIYYEEGNPKASVSPDGYVVFGVGMYFRDTYKVWQEGGKLPDFTLEITSKSTRREDTNAKKSLYERWGVQEYFLYDLRGEYIKTHLRGFALQNGRYVELPLEANRLQSALLGVDFVLDEQGKLRLYSLTKRAWLLSHEEERYRADWEALRAEREAERADAEAEQRRQLEARLAQMEAELEALRRGQSQSD